MIETLTALIAIDAGVVVLISSVIVGLQISFTFTIEPSGYKYEISEEEY